jgi:hypothetical protein
VTVEEIAAAIREYEGPVQDLAVVATGLGRTLYRRRVELEEYSENRRLVMNAQALMGRVKACLGAMK